MKFVHIEIIYAQIICHTKKQQGVNFHLSVTGQNKNRDKRKHKSKYQ